MLQQIFKMVCVFWWQKLCLGDEALHFYCHQLSTRPLLVNNVQMSILPFIHWPFTLLIQQTLNCRHRITSECLACPLQKPDPLLIYFSIVLQCSGVHKRTWGGEPEATVSRPFSPGCQSLSADSESELNDPFGLLCTFLSLVKMESFKKSTSSRGALIFLAGSVDCGPHTLLWDTHNNS